MNQNNNAEADDQGKLPRHMITLSEDHKGKLKALAKKYTITLGEIIGTLLDKCDIEAMDEHFKAIRAAKVGKRDPSLAKKLSNLSPEKLAAIQAIIDQQ